MSESVCETQSKETDARLEALLIEGLSKGEDIPLSPDFWNELKQDAAMIFANNKEGILEV
jgi:antitoxin ParD1/3/4